MTRFRSTVRSKEQRQRVLEKAAELFAKKGFHETTVEDIARALNMTKGSVYYYIPSKQAILYQLYAQTHQRLFDQVRSAVDARDRPDVALRNIITSQIEHNLTENGRMGSLVIIRTWPSLEGRLRTKIVKMRDKLEALVRQTIQDGIDQRVFIDCDPALAGFAILGVVNHIPEWYRPEGRFTKDEIATFFADLLVKALVRGPGRTQAGISEAIPVLAIDDLAAAPIRDVVRVSGNYF